MSGTIMFCADGVLRFTPSLDVGAVSLPLTSVQQIREQSPSDTFLSILQFPAFLEKDSTLCSFLKCLEPWADAASLFTDRNVGAYIKEMKKPSSATNAFDRIELRYIVNVRREMELDESEMPDDPDDWHAWFNRPRTVSWANLFRLDEALRISGIMDDENDQYSVSTDIHTIKNVPLVFNDQPVLMENPPKCDKKPLLDPTCEGVSSTLRESGLEWEIVMLNRERTLTVADFVTSVVCDGLWHETPRGAIMLRSFLEQQMASIDIPDEGDADDTDGTDEKDTTPTIVIADGAFSGLSQQLEDERTEWEIMVQAVSQLTNQPPIKIGKLEPTVVPDQRVFGQKIPQ